MNYVVVMQDKIKALDQYPTPGLNNSKSQYLNLDIATN